jgi:hypothetical protein
MASIKKDIAQGHRNTFLTHISFSIALNCAHQHHPAVHQTTRWPVRDRLNATALQISLGEMAF